MKNGAPRTDPLWGRVSKGLTAALMFSLCLAEARGDAISDLTAYYNKVDAALAGAIERGDIKDARSLLKLRNDLAKELAQKKSLQNSPSSSTPTHFRTGSRATRQRILPIPEPMSQNTSCGPGFTTRNTFCTLK